jgi:two-component system cell cycle response regulator DivK
MKVLLVEDDPIHLKLADAVLTAEGHQVRSVNTAEKATTLIEAEPPDAIVVDLSLPGIDGLTFARKIKQNPATQDVVLIAVTAYPMRWSEKEALKAGCAIYLVKPIDINELARCVMALTDKK